ncbi:MAG: IS1634 family transposase [Desulfomonilaceae bacterium]
MGRLKDRYPRAARYHCIAYDEAAKTLSYKMGEDKLRAAENLDGCHLLKTDRQDLSAEEIWRIYTLLTKAEAALRAMKSPLAERPIFHQLERRVETHIFLCVLAYHLLTAIEKTLSDKGRPISFAAVREALKSHQVCTIVMHTDDDRILSIQKCSSPEPHQKELYRLLDVPLQIIPARKKWTTKSTER